MESVRETIDDAGPTDEGEMGRREASVSAPDKPESLEMLSPSSSSSCMLVLAVSPVLVVLVELRTSPSGTPSPSAALAPASAR